MVVKSISRKSNVGGLVKYILRADTPVKHAERPSFQALYVPGVPFTKLDLRYLHAEGVDKAIDNEIKVKFGGNIQAFIVDQITKQPFVLTTHNLKSRDMLGIIKEFERTEQNRIHKRADQNIATHEILSFKKNDTSKLTPAILKDLAQEYIKLRGPTTQALAVLHSDKSHMHIHICMSSTRLDGMANRISKHDFAVEVKEKFQEYQKNKYPFLESVVQHGRGKNENGLEKNKKTNEREKDKQLLQHVLAEAISKTRSIDELKTILQEHNHEIYFRNGTAQGVKFEGDRKFRFSNLGIDLSSLLEKEAKKAKEDKELTELRNIRSKERTIVKEQTIEQKEEANQQTIIENELSAIREGNNQEVEKENEREIETTYEEDELDNEPIDDEQTP